MDPFKTFTSLVTPLDKVNVDTDQILPKQFLKIIEKKGFGKYLFFDWRFDAKGEKKTDFILNKLEQSSTKILLTRSNFGCGSSREHAVWAIADYGFKAIIASSFAEIFYGNAFKNGILPLILKKEEVDELFKEIKLKELLQLTINLESQTVKNNGKTYYFNIHQFRKKYLLEGLDDIAITMKHEQHILQYESKNLKFSYRPDASSN
jgi:3-isopropylmalate/(R)-2-methylmalate dehydratase small subunit